MDSPDSLLIQHGKAVAAIQHAYDLLAFGKEQKALNVLSEAIGYDYHQQMLENEALKKRGTHES